MPMSYNPIYDEAHMIGQWVKRSTTSNSHDQPPATTNILHRINVAYPQKEPSPPRRRRSEHPFQDAVVDIDV